MNRTKTGTRGTMMWMAIVAIGIIVIIIVGARWAENELDALDDIGHPPSNIDTP